jgi:hypothetical protein
LLNLVKSGRWVDLKISLELFDSPAIERSDVKKFARWYQSQPFSQPLSFNYYLSKGDPVSLAGSVISSSYLGNYITKENCSSAVYKNALTPAGRKKKEIACDGPHDRMFGRGQEGIDFLSEQKTITQIDHEKKRMRFVINIIKLFVMAVVWPTIGLLGVVKRFFFGRRHHDATIVTLFRKCFPRRAAASSH